MELEQVLTFYGFRQCKTNKNMNFLKMNNNDYLLFIIFRKCNTVDLIHAKFNPEENPCSSEPIWEKSIKLSFSPGEDDHILRSYIERFNKD